MVAMAFAGEGAVFGRPSQQWARRQREQRKIASATDVAINKQPSYPAGVLCSIPGRCERYEGLQTHRWREQDSNSRSRCEEQRRRSAPLRTGIRPSRYGSTRGPYYGSNSPGEPCSGGGRCAHFADRVPRPKVTLAANSARPRPGRSEVEASTGLDESAGR
jgi:hypothetical protein